MEFFPKEKGSQTVLCEMERNAGEMEQREIVTAKKRQLEMSQKTEEKEVCQNSFKTIQPPSSHAHTAREQKSGSLPTYGTEESSMT